MYSINFLAVASPPVQCSNTGFQIWNKKCEIIISLSNIWQSYSCALEQGCLATRRVGCLVAGWHGILAPKAAKNSPAGRARAHSPLAGRPPKYGENIITRQARFRLISQSWIIYMRRADNQHLRNENRARNNIISWRWITYLYFCPFSQGSFSFYSFQSRVSKPAGQWVKIFFLSFRKLWQYNLSPPWPC